MDIQLYDNYEDDGQLSLFRFDDSEFEVEKEPEAERLREKEPEAERSREKEPEAERLREKKPETEKSGGRQPEMERTADLYLAPGGSGIRIQRCSSCGKLLFVREETSRYTASCNNCGIEYFQRM